MLDILAVGSYHFPQYLLEPYWGWGYQFWSGIGANGAYLTGSLGIIGLILRHLECHETGCHRHGKYLLEGGVRACDRHHPAQDERPHDERGKVHRLHQDHLAHVHATQRKLNDAHD